MTVLERKQIGMNHRWAELGAGGGAPSLHNHKDMVNLAKQEEVFFFGGGGLGAPRTSLRTNVGGDKATVNNKKLNLPLVIEGLLGSGRRGGEAGGGGHLVAR